MEETGYFILYVAELCVLNVPLIRLLEKVGINTTSI